MHSGVGGDTGVTCQIGGYQYALPLSPEVLLSATNAGI